MKLVLTSTAERITGVENEAYHKVDALLTQAIPGLRVVLRGTRTLKFRVLDQASEEVEQ